MALQYVPYLNDFVTYESAPKVELIMPLMEKPKDITNWASYINENGTPIVSNNLPTATRSTITYNVPTNSEDLSSLSFEDLIKQENLPIKITSGFRKGSKTKSGNTSYHSQKDSHGHSKAYDIVPINGDFEGLLKIIYSNPRIVNWLKQKRYGILEEHRGDIMTKTGATGKHLHIGPDSSAIAMFNKRISKGQEGMKITPFVEYQAAETPKVQLNLPLIENPIDISDWSNGFTPSGTPLVQNNLPTATRSESDYQISELQENTPKVQPALEIKPSKGSNTFSKYLDEVSNETGFENLKNPEIRNLLMLQAQRESSFNSQARAKGSTASGYFQFIDGTRSRYSKSSREQFLKDPKEQIRAAYKYLQDILNMPQAKQLSQKGYNKAQITALGWWYPRSMQMVLDGQKNFSLGGFSIKQALEKYAK